ncbi:MAG TPA: Asp-tRNA(Asn)/Glu-tRNA(Gln) amidotransferase subunit GatC [Gemmatimonadales bacterium]|nr:Asp-tRNA(Asn)/Glu-tRNA(Gln) amidotransferase subunit GatC [Gemmatimonadales bacterium]
MSIGREDVRHVADLAELKVAEGEIAPLVRQLNGIVAFVAQLGEARIPAETPEFAVGPDRVALREDVVAPVPLARSPERMAPDWDSGFYVVPRLAHQEGEG